MDHVQHDQHDAPRLILMSGKDGLKTNTILPTHAHDLTKMDHAPHDQHDPPGANRERPCFLRERISPSAIVISPNAIVISLNAIVFFPNAVYFLHMQV